MNETITSTLIDMTKSLGNIIKTTAPEVWRIMLKQQLVIGIQLLIVSIISLIISIKLFKYVKDKIKGQEWVAGDIEEIFSYFGVAISFFIFILCLIFSIGYFINPEYYAIESLTNMLIPKPSN